MVIEVYNTSDRNAIRLNLMLASSWSDFSQSKSYQIFFVGLLTLIHDYLPSVKFAFSCALPVYDVWHTRLMTCLSRFCAVVNAVPHIWHANDRILRWVLTWACTLDNLSNFLEHVKHWCCKFILAVFSLTTFTVCHCFFDFEMACSDLIKNYWLLA